MLRDEISKLKPYSKGVVIEDKVRGSSEITVLCIEELPHAKGLISEFKEDYEFTLPNVNDVPEQAVITTKLHITAKWLPLSNTNRHTPPDVIKNEIVDIYKYADTEEYYWTTILNQPNIRRLETVRWMFGNLQTPLVEWGPNEAYWFEVSTHDKKIQLQTSDSDGEAFKYSIIVDTKENTITITDNVDNSIVLSSSDGSVNITTNSSVNIKSPSITLDGDVTITKSLTVSDATITSSGVYKGAEIVNTNTDRT